MRSSTPSGMRMSTLGATTISSAKAPTMVDPNTRSPRSRPSTPSPSSTTVPAYSLPKMNGVGTETWYVLATTSTSGKFTAPTLIRTRTWPGPSDGDGISASSMTSGPP